MVVSSDEAHRSQYGAKGWLETFGGYVAIHDIEDAKEDKAVGPDRWGSPLANSSGRCAGSVHEKRMNSLRRKNVEWARHGGHAPTKLDIKREWIAADSSGEARIDE